MESNKKWSGRQDLNLRPLDPQSSALPDCATPRLGDQVVPLQAVQTASGRCWLGSLVRRVGPESAPRAVHNTTDHNP